MRLDGGKRSVCFLRWTMKKLLIWFPGISCSACLEDLALEENGLDGLRNVLYPLTSPF